MINKNRSVIFVLIFLLISVCMSSTAYAHDPAKVEMTQLLEEIIVIAEDLHDQSEFIADDAEPTVGLDRILMGQAEVIHGTSHDIERFASIAQIELEQGLATGQFDEEQITRRITMLYGVVGALSGLVEDVNSDTPQSHRNYADAIKADYDNLEELVVQLDLLAVGAGFESRTTLDKDLMGKAELVHGVSHDIGRFANIAERELNDGVRTGDFDEDEINRRIDMTIGVTAAISDLVTEINNETPVSHREFAVQLTNEYATLNALNEQLTVLGIHEDTDEMIGLLQNIRAVALEIHDISELIADDVDPSAMTEEVEEVSDTEHVADDSTTESLPGFGLVLAVSGLFAVAFFVKKD